MNSKISSMWGKKHSHGTFVPPEQKLSMNRFLTPTRLDSHLNEHQDDFNFNLLINNNSV